MRISDLRPNQTIGMIERRLLISYRADPDVIRGVVPEPLPLRLVGGQAVVGICLLRLGHLRPRGLPGSVGLRSENVAHRIGVEHPTPDGWRPSVYIPIRHSSSRVNVAVGGRSWPGVHRPATIESIEHGHGVDGNGVDGHGVDVQVEGPDVGIRASGHSTERLTSRLFPTLAEASRYYEIGTVGWSPDHHGGIEGMRLEVDEWKVEPFALETVRSSYFDDTSRFPVGTVMLDSALLMRNLEVSCRRAPDISIVTSSPTIPAPFARCRQPCQGRPIIPPEQLVHAEVTCEFTFEVEDHVAMSLHLAPATTAGTVEVEELVVELDGRTIDAEEISVDTGGRVHSIRSGAGQLTVMYRSVLVRASTDGHELTPAEHLVALRQSRYCPSDALGMFAEAELAGLLDGQDRARVIGDWVFERLRYELGSSGPLDTAVDTLLKGQGVCRDFAHLTIALCRAVGIPARLVSVYAPGLSPMDFHAVAEVADAGRWHVIDSTRLAPRPALIRIATGRDAADTAFATTTDGSAELMASWVTATTDGILPADDHVTAVALA